MRDTDIHVTHGLRAAIPTANPARSAEWTPAHDDPSEIENLRILVIDDNEAIHKDFRAILQPPGTADKELDSAKARFLGKEAVTTGEAGFQVHSALQGEQALEMVVAAAEQRRPYAMAFVDMRMPPGWDGLKTIENLWQRCPELEVVICTAYSDYSRDEIVDRLGESQQLLILKKPFDNVEVLQLAHALTKKWQLARQAAFKMTDLRNMVEARTHSLDQARRELLMTNEHLAASKQAAEAANQRNEHLLRSIPMILFGMDSDNRITQWNQVAAEMFERPVEKALGRTLADLGIEWSEHAVECIAKSHRTLQAVSTDDVEFRRPDGSNGLLQLWINPLESDHGSSPELLLLGNDVTEQKRLQARLQQSQKLEAVGQLSAGVAHEFNNLLQAIKGYAGFALDGLDPSGQKAQDLQQVLKAADRGAAIARQLLSFSRRQTLRKQTADVNEIVSDVSKLVRPLLGEQIKLSLKLGNDIPPVLADAAMMPQVLLNLCVNARDAMPGGGVIVITTASIEISPEQAEYYVGLPPGPSAQIAVSDTGCGMAPKLLQRVFEPFFTTKEVGKGTGLGLSMVQGIIQQHGGTVHVYSEPEMGTTFKIFLPVAQQEVLKSDVRHHPVVRGGTETILLAEDEPIVLAVGSRILRHAGYTVLTAEDGEEAVRLYKSHADKIAVAVLDLVMPKLDGRSVCHAICDVNGEAKILFCTGYDPHAPNANLAIPAGCEFVEKPFAPAVLLGKVREAIDGPPALLRAATTDPLLECRGVGEQGDTRFCGPV